MPVGAMLGAPVGELVGAPVDEPLDASVGELLAPVGSSETVDGKTVDTVGRANVGDGVGAHRLEDPGTGVYP